MISGALTAAAFVCLIVIVLVDLSDKTVKRLLWLTLVLALAAMALGRAT